MSTSSEENIFTRYDIYKILMKERPGYRGEHDYYSLERYLSVIYNCDCTDCGGPDFYPRCTRGYSARYTGSLFFPRALRRISRSDR